MGAKILVASSGFIYQMEHSQLDGKINQAHSISGIKFAVDWFLARDL